MALSPIKPDITKAHSFEVLRLVDKDKIFPSQEGQKMKYIIEFTNGYVAEYCPLVSAGVDSRIIPGVDLTFRIIHRKDFGDEIAPYTITQRDIQNKPDAAVIGKTIAMNGHPATIALLTAKDLTIAKLSKMQPPAQGEDDTFDAISETLESADIIYGWLIGKAENP